MPIASKNIFLTGASSGIGKATAELLAGQGHAVWCTSRNTERLSHRTDWHPVEMDLRDLASIESAWAQAVQETGRIDVVIQNAGSGLCGSIEDVSIEQARTQWQVLVEGPLRLLQLAAAHLRPSGGGMIIGVSSLAAELPIPFGAHYSSGKAALSSLLAGLAMELQPFGVRVVDLRPGDIRTPFNDDLPQVMPRGSAYLPWVQAAWKRSCQLIHDAPPSDLIAQAIAEIVASDRPPLIARRGSFFQARLGPLGPRILSQASLLKSIRNYFHLTSIDEQQRRS